MSIPDASSSIYRERALPVVEWERVLAWARFMQTMLNKELRMRQQPQLQEQPSAAGPKGGQAALPAQLPSSPASERKHKPIRCATSLMFAKSRHRASAECNAGRQPSGRTAHSPAMACSTV